jgi:hypothetical protein
LANSTRGGGSQCVAQPEVTLNGAEACRRPFTGSEDEPNDKAIGAQQRCSSVHHWRRSAIAAPGRRAPYFLVAASGWAIIRQRVSHLLIISWLLGPQATA